MKIQAGILLARRIREGERRKESRSEEEPQGEAARVPDAVWHRLLVFSSS
jgi:hypothetical protein